MTVHPFIEVQAEVTHGTTGESPDGVEVRTRPPCCRASANDPIQKRLYAAYNSAGERKGVNYQGLPCPTWEQLPADIQEKWLAVAEAAEEILCADPACWVCGCTYSIPCDGGCFWVPTDDGYLCSCCARGIHGDRMVVAPDDGCDGWVVMDLHTGFTLGDEGGEIVYMRREDAERVARTGIVERMDIDRWDADPEADTADHPPPSTLLEHPLQGIDSSCGHEE